MWSLNEWIGWGQLKVGVNWAWSVKVGVVTALLFSGDNPNKDMSIMLLQV